MRINRETMLFEDLSEADSKEMLTFVRNLLQFEVLPEKLPLFVELWCAEFQYNEDQKYLTLASSLPQMILSSIVNCNIELSD